MDSFRCLKPCVESEFGKLEYVMLHAPGDEVENMTPETAHRFLFSDILNKNEALNDYRDFCRTLQKVSNVVFFDDLLASTLSEEEVRQKVIQTICKNEQKEALIPIFNELSAEQLTKYLIEGCRVDDKLVKGIAFDPIPNLFFMRDASFTMFNDLMVNKMATTVRDRETYLLDTIFNNKNLFDSTVVHPIKDDENGASIEGGDVHIVRNDVIMSGSGVRTNKKGIQALVSHLQSKNRRVHLLVQELPESPESFIHLDMVFTLLGQNHCMAYAPVILNDKFKTYHYTIEGKNVEMCEEKTLIEAFENLGMPLNPVFCGGGNDMRAAREQWHSGANFFAFAPGKILGYERNSYTIEALNKAGFEVLKAADVANGTTHPDNFKKCVVTFKGNELSRGGGGARCMTMPLVRKTV